MNVPHSTKTIGISTLHRESIKNNSTANFTIFLNSLSCAGLAFELISQPLNKEELVNRYSCIIIGAPERRLEESTLTVFREYVEEGGNLFILLKFGGDNVLGTNISNLFPDYVTIHDDMLVSNTHSLQKKWQPLLKFDLEHTPLGFIGTVCYDGGCTFTVKKSNAIALTPRLEEGFESLVKPRSDGNPYRDQGSSKPGAPGVILSVKKGKVFYWGSRWSFSDEMFLKKDNAAFFWRILAFLLRNQITDELEYLMSQPQRHRLLHAYPMSNALKHTPNPRDILEGIEISHEKRLALGIIPHPLCNPTLPSCGFCTFPNEPYDKKRELLSTDAVCRELAALVKQYPKITNRNVASIYFGGGTANLTSPSGLSNICDVIKDNFECEKTLEVTLEGAPAYFSKTPELMETIRGHFPDGRLRISIGIQTFDHGILSKMGRLLMNSPGSVERAISIARDFDFDVSADFLFNLPGQDFEIISQDVHSAINLGIPHICFYNLVCMPGLSAPWARDQGILKDLPCRNVALDNWLRLVSLLDKTGFEPTTVTDFAHKESETAGLYAYERHLRAPHSFDWLGVGVHAISVITDKNLRSGVKLMNAKRLDSYIKKQNGCGVPWNYTFVYEPRDLQIYWLTRQIKGTMICKKTFKSLFRIDLEDAFNREIEILLDKKLIQVTDDGYCITHYGMFFADSVAGIFSWFRLAELKNRRFEGNILKERRANNAIAYNRAIHDWMG